MQVQKNRVYTHKDTNRLMKVIRPRGIVCEAREPKGGTRLVSTAKLKGTVASIDLFRALD